jgi:hypothetical protein
MFSTLFGDITDHYFLKPASEPEQLTDLNTLVYSFLSISCRYMLVFAASKFCADEIPLPPNLTYQESTKGSEKKDNSVLTALNYLKNAAWIVVFSHVV